MSATTRSRAARVEITIRIKAVNMSDVGLISRDPMTATTMAVIRISDFVFRVVVGVSISWQSVKGISSPAGMKRLTAKNVP